MGNDIEVSCTIHPREVGLTSICILNELAADAFTHGFSSGKQAPPPSGWLECGPGNEFYDPVRGLRFGISFPREDGGLPGKVFWGREHTKELSWAGFAIELDPSGSSALPHSCEYRIRFITEPAEGGGSGA
jgi:hypothetical protein